MADSWKVDAQTAIEADAEVALCMCEETADKHHVELYWVVEQFIKEFCRRAKDG